MSSPQPPTYYRSRREERRRRARRRGVILLVLAVVIAAAVLLAVLRPWSGVHLPWSGSAGGSASGSTASSADGSLHIVGAEKVWYNGPATLRFRDADGKPVAASYRIDGGEWQQGKRVHVRGPEDHSADGMHTVEARPLDSDGAAAVSVKVGIDTTPPEVTAAAISPERTDGTGTAKLSFTAPAEDGVTVDWAVVDVLDKPVGEHGEPAAPNGAVSVSWAVPKVDGETLGPAPTGCGSGPPTAPATSPRSAPRSPASTRSRRASSPACPRRATRWPSPSTAVRATRGAAR